MTTEDSNRISLKRMARLFVRLSTGFMLLILLWSCGTVPGLQEEALDSIIRVPFVRVLLDEKGGERPGVRRRFLRGRMPARRQTGSFLLQPAGRHPADPRTADGQQRPRRSHPR